jgi:hypothetical protein
MGSLSGHLRRILTLFPRIERASNSSGANTTANIGQIGKEKKTEEQTGDDARSLLEALPVIDSITATTDIRAFLRPGVPDGLKHAALRQAWATDPAIRDFVGIAENQWDFNKPQNVPGFGLLDPSPNFQPLVSAHSVSESMESQNIPEQPLGAQTMPDNLVRVAPPDIETRPPRPNDGQPKAATHAEGSRQDDA